MKRILFLPEGPPVFRTQCPTCGCVFSYERSPEPGKDDVHMGSLAGGEWVTCPHCPTECRHAPSSAAPAPPGWHGTFE